MLEHRVKVKTLTTLFTEALLQAAYQADFVLHRVCCEGDVMFSRKGPGLLTDEQHREAVAVITDLDLCTLSFWAPDGRKLAMLLVWANISPDSDLEFNWSEVCADCSAGTDELLNLADELQRKALALAKERAFRALGNSVLGEPVCSLDREGAVPARKPHIEELVAAACIWEAMLEWMQTKPNGSLYRYRQVVGTCELRAQAATLSSMMEHAWKVAGKHTDYDDAFDWEFVPTVLGLLGVYAVPETRMSPSVGDWQKAVAGVTNVELSHVQAVWGDV